MVSREGRRTADNSINHYQVIAVNFFFFHLGSKQRKPVASKLYPGGPNWWTTRAQSWPKLDKTLPINFSWLSVFSGIGGRNKYDISIVGTVRFFHLFSSWATTLSFISPFPMVVQTWRVPWIRWSTGVLLKTWCKLTWWYGVSALKQYFLNYVLSRYLASSLSWAFKAWILGVLPFWRKTKQQKNIRMNVKRKNRL